MYKNFIFILSWLIFFFSSCVKENKTNEKVAFTTILPLKYLVSRIGGEEVKVYSLVEKNMDPHTFTITPEQMTKLSKATLIFTIGLESEKNIIPKIQKTNSTVKIVNLGEKIKLGKDIHSDKENLRNDILIVKTERDKHFHCEEKDPHLWTSPLLLRKICFEIYNSFIEIMPQKKDFFQNNLDKIIADIDTIDLFLKNTLSPYKNRKFFVVHPSFSYFADEYGLVQIAVEVDGKEPNVKEMKHLIEMAKIEKPYYLFVQPQFSKRGASIIAREIKCEIFIVDHLAEDILKELYNFGVALKRNFENVR